MLDLLGGQDLALGKLFADEWLMVPSRYSAEVAALRALAGRLMAHCADRCLTAEHDWFFRARHDVERALPRDPVPIKDLLLRRDLFVRTIEVAGSTNHQRAGD